MAVSVELLPNSICILSADVVGSTALYEAVGDARAQSIINDCLTTLKTYCREHHGVALAEIGDQVIARFETATDAASAASEMHVHLSEQYPREGEVIVRMRIGLHYGALRPSDNPQTTQTVKIAEWAASKAKPEQTLATAALIGQLPRIFRAVSRYVDDETWDFVSLEHVELYEIIWDVESITAYNGEQRAREEDSYDSVVFSYGVHSITVNTARPVISIGRNIENDLVIDKDLISRQHLSAQFSRGRCTVTDNSTNGSMITTASGEKFTIKRESFRLNGSGVIVVGRPAKDAADFEIRFRCE